MSMSVTRGEGVTVITVNSDPTSSCPVMFQLLKTLCCGPMCAVSQRLKGLLGGTQTALGVVQVMVGLFHIAIGAIVVSSQYTFLSWLGAPYWLGAIFIVAGLVSILAEKFPSVCTVSISTFVNIWSLGLAVTALVLYAVQLAYGNRPYWWFCDNYDYSYEDRYSRYGYYTPTTPSPEVVRLREKNRELCQNASEFVKMLYMAMEIVILIFSALQLCVTISAVVLGIKALCKSQKEVEKDSALYKPLMVDESGSATV